MTDQPSPAATLDALFDELRKAESDASYRRAMFALIPDEDQTDEQLQALLTARDAADRRVRLARQHIQDTIHAYIPASSAQPSDDAVTRVEEFLNLYEHFHAGSYVSQSPRINDRDKAYLVAEDLRALIASARQARDA